MEANETLTEELPFDPCHYEQPPMTDVRFWIVTVIGSTVSMISIANNVFLFCIFVSKKQHRTSYNMYLMLIAFFDILISVAYIALMSINVLSDYLISTFLVDVWYFYMVPMITISHIAMTSSSFLIVAATFEKYCLTVSSVMLPWAQRNRKTIAGIAVLIGIISKGSMYLEFKIDTYEECAGTMLEQQIGFRDFVLSTPYNKVWRFWYRNFVTIFFPFFSLAILNFMIVQALSASTRLTVCQIAGNAILDQAKRKANARAATRTLVLVVCCYLLSNIINVILTIGEYIDKDYIVEQYPKMYAMSIDMISLLTTLACAFRLPIYIWCMASFRKECKTFLKSFFCKMKRRRIDESEYLYTGDSATTKITSDKPTGESLLVHSKEPSPFNDEATLVLLHDGFATHISCAYETLL